MPANEGNTVQKINTRQLRNSKFYLCTYVTLNPTAQKQKEKQNKTTETYYELHETTYTAMRWDKNYFNQE